MSSFRTYAKNKLVDYTRGQGLTLPGSWHVAFLSAYDADTETEVGVGLSRVAVARSLAAWAGTQGAGTTVASNGTSHTTSNNAAVPMGTATGAAEAIAVGLFDASSGGNCWMIFDLADTLTIADDDTPELAAGLLQFTLGIVQGATDYLANKLVDLLWRGQAYSWPASLYWGLYTVAPTNAGGGTEVGGGVGYGRVSTPSSLDDWSATQGAGTTVASAGTSGTSSNNNAIAFPVPSGSWGTVVAQGGHDSVSGGNLLLANTLTQARTIGAGGNAPTFPAGALELTWV